MKGDESLRRQVSYWRSLLWNGGIVDIEPQLYKAFHFLFHSVMPYEQSASLVAEIGAGKWDVWREHESRMDKGVHSSSGNIRGTL